MNFPRRRILFSLLYSLTLWAKWKKKMTQFLERFWWRKGEEDVERPDFTASSKNLPRNESFWSYGGKNRSGQKVRFFSSLSSLDAKTTLEPISCRAAALIQFQIIRAAKDYHVTFKDYLSGPFKSKTATQLIFFYYQNQLIKNRGYRTGPWYAKGIIICFNLQDNNSGSGKLSASRHEWCIGWCELAIQRLVNSLYIDNL